MKTNTLKALVMVGFTSLLAPALDAGVSVEISVGFPLPWPVITCPASPPPPPPPPPPRVVVVPPPVACPPPAVVLPPRVVVAYSPPVLVRAYPPRHYPVPVVLAPVRPYGQVRYVVPHPHRPHGHAGSGHHRR